MDAGILDANTILVGQKTDGTTNNTAVYWGRVDSTYRFYSVATDGPGNREATPTTPDAATTVVPQPPTIAGAGIDSDTDGTVTISHSILYGNAGGDLLGVPSVLHGSAEAHR